MPISRALYSSTTDEWYTPWHIFNNLDAEFHFTLDPCAADESAMCPEWFTRRDDGLAQDWTPHRVFMNPPYSHLVPWMAKARMESRRGAVVVCLVPARTDTKWWHDYAMGGEIRFVKGRLKFGGPSTAPFPSAVVIFRPYRSLVAPLGGSQGSRAKDRGRGVGGGRVPAAT